MKTYKVKALTVSGLSNKIFRSGETVKENNFKPGRAKELIEQGFLEAIPEVEKPETLFENEVKDNNAGKTEEEILDLAGDKTEQFNKKKNKYK